MSDPDYCLSVIESTFNAAHDAGAGLFAWSNSPPPHMRSSAYPWALRGFVAGVFGVVDHSLVFDSRLGMMEDVDITLLSLVKNRFNWIDNRWLADCGKPWTEGGMSEGRLDSVIRDAYALLQRKYGSGVVKPMKTEKNSPFSDKSIKATVLQWMEREVVREQQR